MNKKEEFKITFSPPKELTVSIDYEYFKFDMLKYIKISGISNQRDEILISEFILAYFKHKVEDEKK